MTTNEIVSLVVGALGGGVIAALLGIFQRIRTERRTRRAKYLQDQIKHLYGPVQFWTRVNSDLLRLHDENRQPTITEEQGGISTTHEHRPNLDHQRQSIAHNCLEWFDDHTERILNILEQHYSFSDPDDQVVFNRFVAVASRLKAETDARDNQTTSLEIYAEYGEISFIREEFPQFIDQRLQKKKAELDKLIK